MKNTVILVLILLFVTACAPQATPIVGQAAESTPQLNQVPGEAQLPQKGASGDAVITLEQSGGLTGKTQTWNIYSDGRVMMGGEQKATLSADAVNQILGDLKALGVDQMKDSYLNMNGCNDCITYTLTIQTGTGKPKTIVTDDSSKDTPAEFWTILKAIKTQTGE